MMWLSLFLSSITAASSLPFITTWSTICADETIVLPTISAQSLVTIDWGDNSANSTINQGTNATGLLKVYTVAGQYNVSIFGEFRWISPTSGNNATKTKLVDIVSWGDGFLVDANSASNLFNGYSNLQVSASPFTQPVFLPGARLDEMFSATSFDSPLNWDLINVTSLFNMLQQTPVNKLINFTNTQGLTSLAQLFANCHNFNQPFTMDIPNVVSVDFMFSATTSFNQPVTLTNSQKLTSTSNMFAFASSFNQPFNLDTRAVTDMRSMFLNAFSFNQPLTFDTSSVTNMFYMLQQCSSFNQTVNFSSTAKVTAMDGMFYNATLFEQDLASWNTSSVTGCYSFCPRCGLPKFPLCPGPCAGGTSCRYTNEKNMSVCYTPSSTNSPTWRPTSAPSTPYPTSTPTTGAPSTASPTSQPTTPAPTLAPSSAAPSLAPSEDLSTVVSSAEKPSVRAGLLGLIAVVVAVLV